MLLYPDTSTPRQMLLRHVKFAKSQKAKSDTKNGHYTSDRFVFGLVCCFCVDRVFIRQSFEICY